MQHNLLVTKGIYCYSIKSEQITTTGLFTLTYTKKIEINNAK